MSSSSIIGALLATQVRALARSARASLGVKAIAARTIGALPIVGVETSIG